MSCMSVCEPPAAWVCVAEVGVVLSPKVLSKYGGKYRLWPCTGTFRAVHISSLLCTDSQEGMGNNCSTMAKTEPNHRLLTGKCVVGGRLTKQVC